MASEIKQLVTHESFGSSFLEGPHDGGGQQNRWQALC
jgi:hypothetical protein